MRKVVKKVKKSLVETALYMKMLVVKEMAEREMASRDIILFAKRVFPKYIVNPLHNHFAKILHRALRSKNPKYRLIVIHAPPQHGKSLFWSILVPAFLLGLYPNWNLIQTSYGGDLATRWGGDVRDLIDTPEYQKIFPATKLKKDDKAKSGWRLANPYKGGMESAGIDGAVTGKSANYLGIDDPYKDLEEALSKITRSKVQRKWLTTFSTRLQENPIVVLSMTRWTQDDIAGYFLSKEEDMPFTYIRIPAIADCLDDNGKGYKDDPLGRKAGERLNFRFSLKTLLQKSRTLGKYLFSALYQGLPKPAEGLMFKQTGFKRISRDKVPKDLAWVRYWDLAVTESQSADYTASLKGAADEYNNVYLDELVYGKWEWPDVYKMIKTTCEEEPEVLCGVEAQGTQKGMAQELLIDPELIGLGIMGVPVSTSKRVRAMPVQTCSDNGKLFIVEAPWNDDYVEEMISFDKGSHDDQVDATSGVFKLLKLVGSNVVYDLNEEIRKQDIEDKENKEEEVNEEEVKAAIKPVASMATTFDLNELVEEEY